MEECSDLDAKQFLNKVMMGLFRGRRQAQIMAVLTSMMDHSVEASVPYVVSGFLDPGLRVVMRMMEMAQTNIPRPKTLYKATFLLFAMWIS